MLRAALTRAMRNALLLYSSSIAGTAEFEITTCTPRLHN
jgi:hypothetical protein